jgi:photosystem II stability/assembly factor-like uncharacterized protein
VPGLPVVSYGQGFDTCAAPALSQLTEWRQFSPYDYFGMYLGGANHYRPCREYNQQYQTAAWLNSVRLQGWQLIPIWVGPQAPCTGYGTVMSSDPATARSEGVAEARQALAAAANLELSSPTIIYYDIEYYDVSDSSCHNAVNAFLAGWVSELQNTGHWAGIYGGVNAANDWYTLWHVPDSTWVARYVGSGYDPGMTVEALNQDYIDPGYHPNHRLFQYSGSHNESWGSVTLQIDNNTAAGLVAIAGNEDSLPLYDAALVTPDWGWVWQGHQLFTWSPHRQWQDISPPVAGEIKAVHFVDSRHGWVATMPGPTTIHLWRTVDGGQRWHSLPPLSLNLPTQAVSFDFLTPEQGWLVVHSQSGANFSRGVLFTTGDGGQSWQQLPEPPGGEAVSFVSDQVGWQVSGPTHSDLYVTRDGGQSWQQPQLPVVDSPQFPAYHLPHFVTEQVGVMVATIYHSTQSQQLLFTTTDGGRQWQAADSNSLFQDIGPGVRFPQHSRGPADLESLSSLPAGVVAVSMASTTHGWAVTRTGACATGMGSCDIWGLRQTLDGGQSWEAVPLPDVP